ncbi:hypothetical protein [Caldimonas sp. KR1-144]|uniref:hypothetical protein n=1 Tax=Caldimonas sp. KR1-144 TaxID=3400911 RepID=UPI003C09E172
MPDTKDDAVQTDAGAEVAAPAAPVNQELVVRARVDLPAIHGQFGDAANEVLSRLGAPSSNRLKVTQSKTFVLPDGTEMGGPLPFVIVDFVAANAWYASQFNPNDITPPDCAAIGVDPNGLKAYDDSPDKQCDTCAACPKNQFGSNGRGKACSNTKLLALMSPTAEPGAEFLKLRVSATALRPFETYVRQLAKTFGRPHYSVLTWIGFDPASTYATLRFGNPMPLDGDLSIEGKIVDGPSLLAEAVARQDEARELLLAKPDFTIQAAPKPAARGGRRG